MSVLWGLIIVLAAVLGSFANMLVYRLPLMIMKNDEDDAKEGDDGGEVVGEGDDAEPVFNIAKPASHCPTCGTHLKWWHNVPLVSFLVLRGRCGFCLKSIPRRYFWIELGVVVLAITAVLTFGWTWNALSWFGFLYVLWVLVWIDARHLLLPDALTLSLLWAGLLKSALVSPSFLPEAVLGAVCGYCVLRLIYEIHFAITRRAGMGHGDMKLLAAMGAWLGLFALPNVLLLACASALVFAVYAKIKHQAVMIPFGPFLAFGAVVVLFLTYHPLFALP